MKSPKIVVVGSLNMDLVVQAQRAPLSGETVMGEEIHFIPGGKGANQAVGLARLGAKTTMIGAVGRDPFGEELHRALQGEGVDCSGIKILDYGATGVASILLSEGDNRIVVVPGVNAFCLPEDLNRHEDKIAEADLVLMQLEIPLETVEHAIKLAKKYGKAVVLNPAPAQRLTPDLLKQIDFLTPNRTELAQIVEQKEAIQLEQAIDNLLNLGVSCCITTLGEDGVAFKHTGGTIGRFSAHRVPVVDTTGAGDAFNAGLAFALAQGQPIADAVSFAGKVSALAVTKLGAQAGMPTLQEVKDYFGV